MIKMYTQKFKSYEIILASNSPRRKQFFEEAGIPFTLKKFEVDEIFDAKLKGTEISDYLVKLKAEPFFSIIKTNQIVVTADTIVWGDELYLGKPKNPKHLIAIVDHSGFGVFVSFLLRRIITIWKP